LSTNRLKFLLQEYKWFVELEVCSEFFSTGSSTFYQLALEKLQSSQDMYLYVMYKEAFGRSRLSLMNPV